MKVQIMTDLEGPAGVNGRGDGIGNKIVNPEIACKCLVEEINACCDGLVKAGATEILVWDGHGGSNSIDITRLHPKASLGTFGGDLCPLAFIDESFTAAIQIGAHAMQGVRDGFLHHSWNSHGNANVWLNGELIGEIGMDILRAAYFGVPTIMVSGDRAACREAKEFLGDFLPVVETKVGLSRYTVVNRPLETVYRELSATAEDALRRFREFPVKKLSGPYELKLQYMCPNLADAREKLGAERLDQTTVLLRSDNLIDLWAQVCGWAPGVHNRKFNIR